MSESFNIGEKGWRAILGAGGTKEAELLQFLVPAFTSAKDLEGSEHFTRSKLEQIVAMGTGWSINRISISIERLMKGGALPPFERDETKAGELFYRLPVVVAYLEDRFDQELLAARLRKEFHEMPEEAVAVLAAAARQELGFLGVRPAGVAGRIFLAGLRGLSWISQRFRSRQ